MAFAMTSVVYSAKSLWAEVRTGPLSAHLLRCVTLDFRNYAKNSAFDQCSSSTDLISERDSEVGTMFREQRAGQEKERRHVATFLCRCPESPIGKI